MEYLSNYIIWSEIYILNSVHLEKKPTFPNLSGYGVVVCGGERQDGFLHAPAACTNGALCTRVFTRYLHGLIPN